MRGVGQPVGLSHDFDSVSLKRYSGGRADDVPAPVTPETLCDDKKEENLLLNHKRSEEEFHNI